SGVGGTPRDPRGGRASIATSSPANARPAPVHRRVFGSPPQVSGTEAPPGGWAAPQGPRDLTQKALPLARYKFHRARMGFIGSQAAELGSRPSPPEQPQHQFRLALHAPALRQLVWGRPRSSVTVGSRDLRALLPSFRPPWLCSSHH